MFRKPQEDVVLAHLLKGRSITQLEALGLYRVFRLAARVHRLRGRGHDIVTTMKEDLTGKPYASYRLVNRNRHGVRKAA